MVRMVRRPDVNINQVFHSWALKLAQLASHPLLDPCFHLHTETENKTSSYIKCSSSMEPTSFLCQHGRLLSGSFGVIKQVKYYICTDKGIWIFLGYSGSKTMPLNWIRSLHTSFLVLEMFFSFIKGWKDHWTANGPHPFNHLISQVYLTFLLISLQL